MQKTLFHLLKQFSEHKSYIVVFPLPRFHGILQLAPTALGMISIGDVFSFTPSCNTHHKHNPQKRGMTI